MKKFTPKVVTLSNFFLSNITNEETKALGDY